MKNVFIKTAFIFALLSLVGCSDSEESLTVATYDVSDVSANSAACGGFVINDGGTAVTARGVCWSTDHNPTLSDGHTTDGTGTGNFTSAITGLTENTTYYVRAYATNASAIAYGEEKSFTTTSATGEDTGNEGSEGTGNEGNNGTGEGETGGSSDNSKLPTVTTTQIGKITSDSAYCTGEVLSEGAGEVSIRGLCWCTNQNPTINDSYSTAGSRQGSFTVNITGLEANTRYYVRAYATNKEGTSYGEQLTFSTNGIINGYEFVDLGLPSGLKWATCNVGAKSPEDCGNYYSWGETRTKEKYDWGSCPMMDVKIGDISGDSRYDVARAVLKSTWRMPTKAEFEELAQKCTWEWTSQEGTTGCKITGQNGNSIFMPAAGFRNSVSLIKENGQYWSSTPTEEGTYQAYYLIFKEDSINPKHAYNRFNGRPIRPVSN